MTHPHPLSPADLPLAAELRLLAQRAARAAGAVARELFDTGLEVALKEDGSEVTEADRRAQDAAVNDIRRTRPADAFIVEEHAPAGVPRAAAPGATSAPGARVCWAIDPIDGTRNYVRGIPYFCCSVGALLDGSPVAGAVYDPLRDILYAGALGQGAFLGDRPRGVRDGEQRTLLGAIPSRHHKRVSRLVHAWVDRLVVRNTGSTALHLALVAVGQLDAALATDAQLWDIAAGCALVLAGGGVVSDPAGRPLFPVDVARYAGGEMPVLAAGPRTHARLIVPALPDDP